jgi:hypothetical protein
LALLTGSFTAVWAVLGRTVATGEPSPFVDDSSDFGYDFSSAGDRHLRLLFTVGPGQSLKGAGRFLFFSPSVPLVCDHPTYVPSADAVVTKVIEINGIEERVGRDGGKQRARNANRCPVSQESLAEIERWEDCCQLLQWQLTVLGRLSQVRHGDE